MTSPVTFLKQTRDELLKVTWPTRAEVIRLTFAVIVISVLVAAFIGALDFLFTKGLQNLIDRANNARATQQVQTTNTQSTKQTTAPSKNVKPTTAPKK